MGKKTKVCRTCGTEVDKSAEECPYCYADLTKKIVVEEKFASEDSTHESSVHTAESSDIAKYEIYDFTGTLTYTMIFKKSFFSISAKMENYYNEELPSYQIKSNFFKNKFTISCLDKEDFEEATLSFPLKKTKGSFKLKQGKHSFYVRDKFTPPFKKIQVLDSHKSLAVEFEQFLDDIMYIKTTQIIDDVIWQAVGTILEFRFAKSSTNSVS
ncbi:MAG: hypothetical protein ACTSYA_00680 [Candidatus Kariarchaeaceae archaeon]